MTIHVRLLSLMLFLFGIGHAAQEVRPLEAGQSVEREIAGGESHTYQIQLAAGQFGRFRLEQRAIDAALILSAPDGKQLVEMNLTGAVSEESLSLEAATAGSYRLTIRGVGVATLHGSYRLKTTVRAIAIAQDRKRLAAEALLIEAKDLEKQRAKTAQQVIERLQQALPLWRELGEPSWTAWSLYRIGRAYGDLRLYDKAIEYFEQGLAIYHEVKDRANETQLLHHLAVYYHRLSRYEKAIEYYEKALAIARDLKDRPREGITLRDLGLAYHSLSRFEKAIEYYDQALAIVREVQDRAAEGVTLANLALTYLTLSRYEKAIESSEQALAIARDLKDRSNEAIALSNLGLAYHSLSRPEKAIEYYEQALALHREVKDQRGEAKTLSNLGFVHNSLSRYEKAIEYYEQALAIAREVKSRAYEGTVLANLGGAYNSLGRPEKAIEYYEQALGITREVKDRFGEADMLDEVGVVYRSLGRLDEAVRSYEQAAQIAGELKATQREAAALNHLATVERSRGNLVRARTFVEESLRITESLRAGVVSPESRASILASRQSSYQLHIDVLMRLHQAQPAKGFDALAVEVSERQRARSLLDLLAEANTDLRKGVDPILIEREHILAKQLNDKAQTQTSTPEQVAALKREISQLESDYERAQAAIRKASPHYAALVQPQPLKLKEIQAQLDANTLLLEYALSEERSYVWAITKDSLTSYELPKGELIEKNALQVYELLTARSTNKRGESAPQRQERISQAEAKLPAAAQELSQAILAPVAAQVGNKRLVIVADGALQYIPFAMLPEPKDEGGRMKAEVSKRSIHPSSLILQPLIVRHEVVSLPSASALAIQRRELAGRQLAPKMLAVIADPVFDRSDLRFTTPATATGDKTLTLTSTGDDARSIEHLAENSGDKSGVTTLRLVIPRLPFTRQEASQLMALAPKGSSFSAIDFQASRATVLDPALSQYRYVHVATHGWLDAERPGLSALVFSMVDAQGQPQNGFLRANDIYNLKLPAELVVLSACQTGLGKEIKGEGLVGLTRGFMYAGAARVVVSLWNVNDKATADLMTRFYEKMLKQGQRPAAALRAAQVEMWKQRQWQSPYYWAAFTMQGEWR